MMLSFKDFAEEAIGRIISALDNLQGLVLAIDANTFVFRMVLFPMFEERQLMASQ